MMYAYMELPDETQIVHSHIIEKNGEKQILVHFERPTEYGFDSARCSLPSYEWITRHGYTDDEIKYFDRLLHFHAHVIYKYAEMGGINIA